MIQDEEVLPFRYVSTGLETVILGLGCNRNEKILGDDFVTTGNDRRHFLEHHM